MGFMDKIKGLFRGNKQQVKGGIDTDPVCQFQHYFVGLVAALGNDVSRAE